MLLFLSFSEKKSLFSLLFPFFFLLLLCLPITTKKQKQNEMSPSQYFPLRSLPSDPSQVVLTHNNTLPVPLLNPPRKQIQLIRLLLNYYNFYGYSSSSSSSSSSFSSSSSPSSPSPPQPLKNEHHLSTADWNKPTTTPSPPPPSPDNNFFHDSENNKNNNNYKHKRKPPPPKRPSIGCASLSLTPWFSHLPPSFCSLSPLLLYAQQHTGSTLFTTSLTSNSPSFFGLHELFCCDNCPDRALALSNYLHLACALRLPEAGLKYAHIGLHYDQFWYNRSWALEVPRKWGASVVMLKRDNVLSWFLAGAGKKSRAIGDFVPRLFLESLPQKMQENQNRYRETYCALKRENVNVMIITYEELIANHSQTIQKVKKLVMEREGEGEGEGEGEATGEAGEEEEFHVTHQPIINRITNVDEVKEYLEKNHPEYLCLLTENCIFPQDFDCAFPYSPFVPIFPSSSSSSSSSSFSSSFSSPSSLPSE